MVVWQDTISVQKMQKSFGGLQNITTFAVYYFTNTQIMKKFITFFTCAICLTFNMFAARQATTEVRGTVTDAAGAPVGFATAFLSNADGAVVSGTSADAEGRFSLKAAQGTYTFTVSLVGYRDAVQTVTL